MSEDKIWQMVDAMTEMEFKVKDGVIRIVDPSHVCMMEIRNVKLKDGYWIMEGKGAKMKPVKFDGLYGNPPAMPKMELPCKISLGSTENIFKVLKQMGSLGDVILMESNSKTLKLSIGQRNYSRIEAVIPTTNIEYYLKGVGKEISDNVIKNIGRSHYKLHYLIQPFRYLNPTSLEFGPNFPIKLEGKNWTWFLAPRIEGDA